VPPKASKKTKIALNFFQCDKNTPINSKKKKKKTKNKKILIFFSLKRKQQCFHFILFKFSLFLNFFMKGILVIGGTLTSFDSLEGTLSQLKVWQTLSIRW
jgi:cytoskeletal protein RodZ